MRAVSRHLNYANVGASIALFLALSGGAYAVAGNPFVGTSGAISMCVQPGTNELHALRRGDRCPSGYAALTLTQGKRGERGRRGARGPAGPAGARGPTGPAGGAGFTVYQGDVKNQSIVLVHSQAQRTSSTRLSSRSARIS